jgi:hypothetical protein
MDVGDRRVCTPIAAAPYREMKDVAAMTLGVEVARSSPLRERVRPQVRGVLQVGRFADALLHQVDKLDTGSSFGEEGQDDEASVVVSEAFAGPEALGVSIEHCQVVDGLGQGVHRHRQHIVIDLVCLVLIEVRRRYAASG